LLCYVLGGSRKQSPKILDTGQKKVNIIINPNTSKDLQTTMKTDKNIRQASQSNRKEIHYVPKLCPTKNIAPVKNIAIAPRPYSGPIINTMEGIKIGGQLQTLSGHNVVFKSFNKLAVGHGTKGTPEGHQITQFQVPGGGTKYILSSTALVKGLKLNNPSQSMTFNVQNSNSVKSKEATPSNTESVNTSIFNPQITNIMGNLNGKPIILRAIQKSDNSGKATCSTKVAQNVVKPSSSLPPPVIQAPVSKVIKSSTTRSILLPKIPTSQIIKPKVPLILLRSKRIEPKVESIAENQTIETPVSPSKKPRMLAPKPYIPVTRMCRLCGVPDLSTVGIFTPHGNKLGLAEKIALHLPIEVSYLSNYYL
jgi:hypothetical protein